MLVFLPRHRHLVATLAQRKRPQDPQIIKTCPLCGTQVDRQHSGSKKHMLNEVLIKILDPIAKKTSFDSIELIKQAREAVGLPKKADYIKPEQLSALQALTSIKESGIALRRFKAIVHRLGDSAESTDLCTEAEQQAAKSLLRISQTGVSETHFLRTSDLLKARQVARNGWCSPDHLAVALRHKMDCTVQIDTTGLELSRFLHLGINGDTCTPEELQCAADLINARTAGIPLCCYELYDEAEDDDGEDDEEEDDEVGEPIWVTQEDVDDAEASWDSRISWAEIFGLSEFGLSHPWDD